MSHRWRWLLPLSVLPLLGGATAVPEEWAVKVQVFSDNRDVTVASPQGHAWWDVAPGTRVSSSLEVDAVSSASPACMTCHRGTQMSPRLEAQLGVTRRVGNGEVGLGYYGSQEQDYSANALRLTLERNFAQNNTTIRAGIGFSLDQVHPHGWKNLERGEGEDDTRLDPAIVLAPDARPLTGSEGKRVGDAEISLTQVLGPGTLARATVQVFQVTGEQNNPYWTLPIGGLYYLESVPDERTRRAASLRLKQSLSPEAAVEAGYRKYTDSWGVRSDTIEGSVSRYFGDRRYLVTVAHRYYDQSAADFHRDRYHAPAEVRSSDYRLDSYVSRLSGVKLRIDAGGSGATSWRPGYYDVKVERYASTGDFRSYILELGAGSGF